MLVAGSQAICHRLEKYTPGFCHEEFGHLSQKSHTEENNGVRKVSLTMLPVGRNRIWLTVLCNQTKDLQKPLWEV